MSHARRTKLARRLAANSTLTYQQALAALSAHTAAGHSLPRTDAELTALTTAPEAPRQGGAEVGETAAASAWLAPLTAPRLQELMGQLKPGVPVTSRWVGNASELRPHRRVLVAVQVPGHVVPGSDLPDGEYALGLGDPADPSALSWLHLPSTPADRPDRWLVGHPSAGLTQVQYLDQSGLVVGDYLFDTSSRAALHQAGDVVVPKSFAIRYSAIGRCPTHVLSVAHYLTDGTCAHATPTCPTCGGVGLLGDGARVVTCATMPALASGAPVCEGSGTWSGARSK